MTYKQQFLEALKSIFIGGKVEGESGYINLMKIKASYFENDVFPQLMKDIDATGAILSLAKVGKFDWKLNIRVGDCTAIFRYS